MQIIKEYHYRHYSDDRGGGDSDCNIFQIFLLYFQNKNLFY